MRFKYKQAKEVEGRWLCTGCLTRYDSKTEAKDCAEKHNNLIVRDILKSGTNIIYCK